MLWISRSKELDSIILDVLIYSLRLYLSRTGESLIQTGHARTDYLYIFAHILLPCVGEGTLVVAFWSDIYNSEGNFNVARHS